MAVTNRTPIRFSLLTVIVWLAVAAGIIFLLWQVITRISGDTLPISTAVPDLTQVYQTNTALLTMQQTSTATTLRPDCHSIPYAKTDPNTFHTPAIPDKAHHTHRVYPNQPTPGTV